MGLSQPGDRPPSRPRHPGSAAAFAVTPAVVMKVSALRDMKTRGAHRAAEILFPNKRTCGTSRCPLFSIFTLAPEGTLHGSKVNPGSTCDRSLSPVRPATQASLQQFEPCKGRFGAHKFSVLRGPNRFGQRSTGTDAIWGTSPGRPSEVLNLREQDLAAVAFSALRKRRLKDRSSLGVKHSVPRRHLENFVSRAPSR